MDIQAYISSGIIETYVLGLASENEARELEHLCTQHPEVQAAVDAYQQSLEAYALLHAATPPEGMKERIWQSLETGQEDAGKHVATVAATSPRTVLTTRKSNLYKYLSAASLLLLAGSIVLNMLLSGKLKDRSAEMRQLAAHQANLEEQNRKFQSQLSALQQDASLMMDPSVRKIALSGVPAHPDMKVMVLWHTQSKDVYLSFNNLPAPPPGKQYQLWAIVDGKPVDAGTYSSDGMSTQKMKVIEKAEMFAITLENMGGNPTPTLDQMFAAGKVI